MTEQSNPQNTRPDKEPDILQQEKKAVEEIIAIRSITADNAVFRRTEGGFVSLEYANPGGGKKTYPRVSVHRCFPFSDPTRFISIREPEADGREIGLIEDLDALPREMRAMLEEQMGLRYFTPKIRRVNSIKEEYGYAYWDVLTDRGACRFTVRMGGGGNVYSIGPNRYLVNDIDGNRFEIPDLYKLSAREIKQLDLFI